MRNSRNKPRKKEIPETLGNGACCVWPYLVALILNACLHMALFIFYGSSLYNFIYLFISFIFFIYPFYFVTDVIWSLRPSVCAILAGKTLINRKYYMNTTRKRMDWAGLLPVTVSIPVYTEDNEVIFETIRQSLAATKQYFQFSGQPVGVIVSDDGIAPMLGGFCTAERVDGIVDKFKFQPQTLSARERKAAARICFYREMGVAFVIRPAAGRAGLFKKASNLNYTLRLGQALSQGQKLSDLISHGGKFANGYAEGNIITNEIILLLDKDSGVKEKIIQAIVPEFAADDKLAYVQCATQAVNLSDNYFSYATGHQVNNLFLNIWPCKALQGFFVPMVGHNVFIRKSILEKSGLWSENKVSEDYDKAIGFYNMGYHGKYAQLKGLEFTEFVSRTFAEETGKQLRYAYGLFEMIFEGTIVPGKTRKCDALYMLLYFCSVVNEVMLLPTVLVESYFGNIHLLWAGFMLCNICFIFLPWLRGRIMSRYLPKEQTEKGLHTLIIAVSFVGHAFAMLSGAGRYFANKLKTNRKSFPSTSVDQLEYRFWDGVKLIMEFIRKNKGFIPIAILCMDRGLFMITRKGIELLTRLTYCYVLFGTVLVPIFLTPQLFMGRRRKSAQITLIQAGIRADLKFAPAEGSMTMPIPFTQTVSPLRMEESFDSDVASFLNTYQQALQLGISSEEMPVELSRNYFFESCIRKDPENKKEIYLLSRIADGAKAILKITRNYPEEDALEEAKLLERLNHPGIPKLYAAYESGEKKYIVREYVPGRTLYEIVKTNGILSSHDIFRVILKLTEILSYLHHQTPAVIHRDIKPQNIIVSPDGSIHLIDFGIARVHKEGRTQDTAVVLTLDYAPPEQYGFDQTSALTDIYSAGMVMLFLATGHTIRTELEAQIINNRLRTLIERCIAFDPKFRMQSVEEIREYIKQDNSRRKNYLRLAAAVGIVIAGVGLSTLAYGLGTRQGEDSGRKIGYENGYGIGYTDGYEDAPVSLPGIAFQEGARGNLAGNLAVRGGAFAVQSEGRTFYLADGNIYRISEMETQPELLVEGKKAEGLSYYNGWLYYSTGSQIIQTNIYTNHSDILCDDMDGQLYIEDGNYYIVSPQALWSLDIKDGSKSRLGAGHYKHLNLQAGKLYFTDQQEQGLYCLDLQMQKQQLMADGHCRSICLYQNQLYALLSKEDSTELIQFELSSGRSKVLAEINADLINVTNSGIYYIDCFDGSLNVSSPDGKMKTKISTNQATDFNIAGDRIFYHNQQDNNKLWCVRLDGTDDHPVQARR
ncbi:DUF5050 domain-containing protein [Clostridiales bacterium COT073_COT-073]|nr:DUF5050 domain-containing protein [Clostridiales bacterium COT073_COT-073]